MDRIIDNKRIEAWKRLEGESKKIAVPVLVNLEQLITEDTNVIPLERGSPVYCTIAKSSIYLNQNGDPELMFVYKIYNVTYETKYMGHTPTSREFGPFLVAAKKFNCLGYARKTIDKLAAIYELIPKPDSLEKIKRFFGVIKLLDEHESLRQYKSAYAGLIDTSKFMGFIQDDTRLKFEQLKKKMDELIASLKEKP